MENLSVNSALFGDMPLKITVPEPSAGEQQMLQTIFDFINQPFDITGNGTTGSADIWSMGNSTGTNKTQQQESKPKNITTNNYAKFWDNLKIDDADKENLLTQLRDKEAEIEEAENAYKTAKANGDLNAQKAQAKLLAGLRNDFKKLEKTLSNETSPSKAYGENSFKYGNIDESELKQIKEQNFDIQQLQAELAEKEQELRTANEKIVKARQKVAARGGNPDKEWKSEFSNEYLSSIENYGKDIKELRETISDKIENLSGFIKKAGKGKDSVDFYIYNQDIEDKKTSEKAKSANGKVCKNITDGMFDGNKLKTKETFADYVDKMKDDDFGKYNSANVKDIANFLHDLAEGKSKEDFIKFIKSADFIKEVKNNELFDETKVGDDAANQNLALLMQMVNELSGSGTFEKTAKEHDATWANVAVKEAKDWKAKNIDGNEQPKAPAEVKTVTAATVADEAAVLPKPQPKEPEAVVVSKNEEASDTPTVAPKADTKKPKLFGRYAACEGKDNTSPADDKRLRLESSFAKIQDHH